MQSNNPNLFIAQGNCILNLVGLSCSEEGRFLFIICRLSTCIVEDVGSFAHFYVLWRKNFFQCLCQKFIHFMHSECLEFEIGYMRKPWIYRKMQSGCKMQTMPSFFKTSTCRVLYELHLTSYVIPFVRFYMMTTASRELACSVVGSVRISIVSLLKGDIMSIQKKFLQTI